VDALWNGGGKTRSDNRISTGEKSGLWMCDLLA
jgi:hypothetical protein